jgi:hypothetical protein
MYLMCSFDWQWHIDLGQIYLCFDFWAINTACWEQDLLPSPKQTSLFLLADAVWFTWLGLLMIWKEGEHYQKVVTHFSHRVKSIKDLGMTQTNLHLKYSCPSPSPEMTFKLFWGTCCDLVAMVHLEGFKYWDRERNIQTCFLFQRFMRCWKKFAPILRRPSGKGNIIWIQQIRLRVSAKAVGDEMNVQVILKLLRWVFQSKVCQSQNYWHLGLDNALLGRLSCVL